MTVRNRTCSCLIRAPKPAFGSDGGGGEPSLFSDKNISQKCGPLRNADGFRSCWEHRPLKRQERPLTRVHAVVCSQRWLISLRGKSGRIEGVCGGGGRAHDFSSRRPSCSRAVNRSIGTWLPFIDKWLQQSFEKDGVDILQNNCLHFKVFSALSSVSNKSVWEQDLTCSHTIHQH